MILLAIFLIIILSYVLLNDFMIKRNVVLKLILSYLFTITILAFCYILFLFLRIEPFIFEIVSILIPSAYLFKRKEDVIEIWKSIKAFSIPTDRFTLIVWVGIMFYSLLFFGFTNKWGDWDAWAIWNLHAKFLAYPETFSSLFTNEIAWTHPDYPLLLPSIIAMIWNSLGVLTPVVPAIIAYFTGLSLIMLIVYSFREKGLKAYAYIALIIFTCPIISFSFVSSQYADVMLGIFILLPFLLLEVKSDELDFPYFMLIGFFAASATWIKNEGSAFYLIFAILFTVKYFRSFRRVLYFILGSSLPLFVFVVFKVFYAPVNDLVDDQSGDLISKLTDVSRYLIIIKYFVEYLLRDVQVLYFLLVGILIINYRFYFSFSFLTILGLLGAYFLIYLVTPHGLEWHLASSFDRLVIQLLPTLVYSVLVFCSRKITINKI